MSGAMESRQTFNESIDNWNTCNVTSMKEMFGYAIAFNQPIDNWYSYNAAS
jgi:hypothetical protein